MSSLTPELHHALPILQGSPLPVLLVGLEHGPIFGRDKVGMKKCRAEDDHTTYHISQIFVDEFQREPHGDRPPEG